MLFKPQKKAKQVEECKCVLRVIYSSINFLSLQGDMERRNKKASSRCPTSFRFLAMKGDTHRPDPLQDINTLNPLIRMCCQVYFCM